MFGFDANNLVPLFIFAIPIIAVTGGIVIAIVQTLSRHRMVELAQRERIAAIERGIDPSKLPPINFGQAEGTLAHIDPSNRPISKAQGLLIGGLVTLFCGIGLSIFLGQVTQEPGVWAVGLIPGLVGLALLISAMIIWPRSSNAAPPPRP